MRAAALKHLRGLPFYPARDPSVLMTELLEARVRSAIHVARSRVLSSRSERSITESRALLANTRALLKGPGKLDE